MSTEAFVKALRAIADFYEANPEFPMPSQATGDDWLIPVDGREPIAAAARMFGTCEKWSDPAHFGVSRSFGPMKILVYDSRRNVCERRVVGTRMVEKQVPTEFRTVRVEEEIVEWDCPKLLEKGGA